LPELVASSRQEYESLALALASDAERLGAIRQKLARNILTQPLFDTALFARHIEAAYTAMQERALQGLPPEDFAVPE
jgi:predicted O-linked N-acetylglucosamine transferase (SPINDLY family)